MVQVWDREAARQAQDWAEECSGLQHSAAAARWTRRFGTCGENIFIASHKVGHNWTKCELVQ